MVAASRAMTWAWLVLVSITVASWWLAPAHAVGAAVPSVGVTAVVLVLALVKSRLIIRYFMEVRSAPRWLRIGTDVWLVLLLGSIFGIHLL